MGIVGETGMAEGFFERSMFFFLYLITVLECEREKRDREIERQRGKSNL